MSCCRVALVGWRLFSETSLTERSVLWRFFFQTVKQPADSLLCLQGRRRRRSHYIFQSVCVCVSGEVGGVNSVPFHQTRKLASFSLTWPLGCLFIQCQSGALWSSIFACRHCLFGLDETDERGASRPHHLQKKPSRSGRFRYRTYRTDRISWITTCPINASLSFSSARFFFLSLSHSLS